MTLDVEGSARELALAEVAKALVQVELNRPRTTAADEDLDATTTRRRRRPNDDENDETEDEN